MTKKRYIVNYNEQYTQGAVYRAPFVIFGAFGILSLSTGAGAMQIDDAILGWLKIWRAITRPVWSTLLHPFEAWLNFSVPPLAKDYLSMGVVTYGMFFRYVLFYRQPSWREFDHQDIVVFFKMLITWPLNWIGAVFRSFKTDRKLFKTGLCTDRRLRKRLRDLRKDQNSSSERIARLEKIVERVDREQSFVNRAISVYFETIIWFLLVLAFNYALLFQDGDLRFGD